VFGHDRDRYADEPLDVRLGGLARWRRRNESPYHAPGRVRSDRLCGVSLGDFGQLRS